MFETFFAVVFSPKLFVINVQNTFPLILFKIKLKCHKSFKIKKKCFFYFILGETNSNLFQRVNAWTNLTRSTFKMIIIAIMITIIICFSVAVRKKIRYTLVLTKTMQIGSRRCSVIFMSILASDCLIFAICSIVIHLTLRDRDFVNHARINSY